ncbi:MAG TPA: DUF3306 domain-containing protein [Limnobacter sp.]|nr:DUF3306 domain-containing protein [Limnobacter sp.]
MSDNFLSRWSRRKLESKNQQVEPQQPEEAAAKTPALQQPESFADASLASAPASTGVATEDQEGQVHARNEQAMPAALPTEADLAAVQQGGDIKAFMVDKVSRELKNKAFKALFSRPEFNVMDGLDIYIDDYNKFTPLSADDISKMTLSGQLLSRPDLELPKTDDIKAAANALSSASTEAELIASDVLDKHVEVGEFPPEGGGGRSSLGVYPDEVQATDSEQISSEQSFENPSGN